MQPLRFFPGDLRRKLDALDALDRQYGAEAPLALEGVEDLVASILEDLARDENRGLAPVLDVAAWALRHGVEITFVEPVVNVLAERSNAARSPEALAAVFALMQGVIANVSPRLSADLERSNPERPWRLLHLNLAITAIRTEDPAMIDYAFDALEKALPEERAGFFAEAMALALNPGVKADVRERIERRHAKWTREG